MARDDRNSTPVVPKGARRVFVPGRDGGSYRIEALPGYSAYTVGRDRVEYRPTKPNDDAVWTGSDWKVPPVKGAFWDGQGWDMPVPDKGGLFGGGLSDFSGFGLTEKLTGSSSLARALDPVGDVAVNDIAQGRNVFQSLQRTMGENQENITQAMKGVGTGLGEGSNPDGFFGGLAGWGENLTKAENKNLGAQSTAHQQVNKGDVSQGIKTGAQGQKEFFGDKSVQSAIAVAATMGAASAMVPYLMTAIPGISSAAATALANGIVNTGMTTMRTGDIEQGLKTGLASGLTSYLGSSWTPGTGYKTLDAGIKGTASSAIGQGITNDGKVDWNQALLSGAASGAQSGIGQAGKEYGLSSGTTKALSGAVSGAITGGQEGALQGGLMGAATGFGGEYGGKFGSQLGGMLAKNYIAGEKADAAQAAMRQKYQQYLNSRGTSGMMTGTTAGNSQSSRCTPQQMQQLYARFQQSRRA